MPVRQIWTGRKTILLTTALFVVLGGLYIIFKILTVIPEYESRVTLYVDSSAPEIIPALITGAPFLTEVLKIRLNNSVNNQDETGPNVLNNNTKPPQGSVSGLMGRISAKPGKAGTIELSVMLQDPAQAKQLADSVAQKLSPFLIAFQMQRVQKNLEYLEARYLDSESAYQASLKALSDFYDQHAANVRTMDTIAVKRLRAESDLKFDVYSELAKELEKARIKEQEALPVYNILEPASVASQNNAPKTGKIMVIMLFLGFIAGIGLLFGKKFVTNFTQTIPKH